MDRQSQLVDVTASDPSALTVPSASQQALLARAATAADHAAAANVFADYRRQLAPHTRIAHDQDLACYVRYLSDAGLALGALAVDPDAWATCSWGLLEGFKRWLLQEGYAIATINRALATVKAYVRRAAQVGALAHEQAALIANVKGYSHKHGRNLDATRPASRRGDKKAEPVHISLAHARALKQHTADTPQARRDALLMCLLLDHGLRVGEVAALALTAINLQAGTLTFYRAKVDLTQTHLLTPATLRAALAYLTPDLLMEMQTQPAAPLLRGSRKNGTLYGALGIRAIQARVRALGAALGLPRLSPHDCRHYWASAAITGGTDLLALQEAGGWASLAMPRRYVERAQIANDRVKLQT